MSAGSVAATLTGPEVVRGYSSRYGRAALDAELRTLPSASGPRHTELFKAACKLGELVAGGELDEELAYASLVRVGLVLKPSASAEITRTVRAGLTRGGSRRVRRAPQGGEMLRDAMDARLAAHALLERAAHDPAAFAGAAGTSELRVFLALTLTAIRAGKVRLGFSLRQLGELAGLSHETVRRALVRLERKGWLRRTHTGSQRRSADRSTFALEAPGRGSGEYQLVLAHGATSGQAGGTTGGGVRQCHETAVLPPAGSIEGLEHPGHDLWRRRGSAWRLFAALSCEPDEGHAAEALAARLGMARRTVYRNLAWLAAVGVVTHLEGRWQRAGTPEEVLATHRIPAHTELARHRHRLERRVHRLRLQINARWGRHHRGDLDRRALGAELATLHTALYEVLDELGALAERRRAELAASSLPALSGVTRLRMAS